jgi:hypothetical protein
VFAIWRITASRRRTASSASYCSVAAAMTFLMPLSLPGFDQYPNEGKIIGRLLAGYNELEYAVGMCLSVVLDDMNIAVKVMFRTRGEEQRLEIADALMHHKYESAGLGPPYCEAMADAHWCRRIRNQYSHCLFDTYTADSLHFVALADSAKQRPAQTFVDRKPVDMALLKTQEEYFGFVQGCLFFLREEYLTKAGKSSNHGFSLPIKITRPPLHNG